MVLLNNDQAQFFHWTLHKFCDPNIFLENDENMTINEFLLEAKYKPRKRMYERTLPSDDKSNNEFVDGGFKEPANNTAFGSSQNVNSPSITPTSPLTQKLASNEYVSGFVSLYNSRICFPPMEKCSVKAEDKTESCTRQVTACDSSWPILSDFEKCQFYSMKVYDKSKNVLYKNPHCAKCNFASLSKEEFSCNDLATYFAFRKQYGTRIGGAFSILFRITDQSPRKCPKRNEIWNPFNDQCSKIICGIGRVLKKGECVKNENENYTRNDTQNSSLLNNCPTIPVTNFTMYENDSIYYYTGDRFYDKGDYELLNDSVILICAESNYYFKKNYIVSYYVTVVVLSISLVCLAFHISLYFCYSRLRTWHGRNLVSLCFSLFMAQFLFLTGTTATENFGFCVFMAVCIHFFWLASFFWMNILSIDVWRTFKAKYSHNSNNRKVFLIYNLYSWGVPFIIVMVSLTLDLASKNLKYKPNYAGIDEAELCWINNKYGLLCFFLLPIAIIMTENVILFTITSYLIYSQSKETRFARFKSQSMKIGNEQNLSAEEDKVKKQVNNNNKIRFVLYLKLGILQGLTWVFGFLASYVDSQVCWKTFTILNGLQGAAIVLSFDLKKWIFISIESDGKEVKENEKKPYKKRNENVLNKAKDSVIRSAFLNKTSLKFRSYNGSGSSNENVSSDSSVINSKNSDQNSENPKTQTSNLSQDTTHL
ncbi:putative G-protein coupled receptor Mth-like 4 [Armadillidium vulgare]|nr:putative G-protein coupled receptor Mth-like 4 [Armadillidium vulgare]